MTPRAPLSLAQSRTVAAGALSALLAGLLAIGCSDAPQSGSSADPRRVALSFAAQINGEPFACGRSFSGIGSSAASMEPSDLRFYISNLRLVARDGSDVPMLLDQDGIWQRDGLALLDFEDATGRCSSAGTPETNAGVRGEVDPGEYVGVRFTMGVPFELNHANAAIAPAPLDKTALFWNWNAGYRFLLFDSVVEPGSREYRMHVGSTRCQGDGRGNVSSCGNPNRVEVELLDFDHRRDAVVADFASLFVDNDVTQNAPDTPPGCMGSAIDGDCAGPFAQLGLPFEGRPAGVQHLFRVGVGLAQPVPSTTPAPSATPTASSSSGADFTWMLPPGFPRPIVPNDNPMSDAKVELGRYLFFDKRLSRNGTESCGSCHQQERAFTDGRSVSLGSTGETTPRNAPSVVNAAYSPTLTWMNPLVVRLEDQALVPLFGDNPVELGFAGREDELLSRLRDDPTYRQRFADSFPGDPQPITIGNLTKAIAAFERTIISGRSPYDRYLQGDDTALSSSALRGMDLFFSELLECDHCHGGLNFASALTHEGNPRDQAPFENNGLYNIDGKGAYPEPNTGLHAFTGDPGDMGKMKPPTLRNIALTAPYMHDGSIETLEEVIDHYARGGRRIADGPFAGDGATSPTKSAFVTGFPLGPAARADMIEFLTGLTDSELISDPRLSDPFANPSGAP